MLKANEIEQVKAIAGVVFDGFVETTDATPETVYTYTMTAAEVVIIEVICTALKDTTAGFASRMAKTFFYNGGAVQEGGWWGYVSKEYLGTGLSTCDFSFAVDGADVSVEWTGEAGASIHADVTVLRKRTVNINLP